MGTYTVDGRRDPAQSSTCQNMTDSRKILFMDSKVGNRNFIDAFRSQANISRLSSNSDLVLNVIRKLRKKETQGNASRSVNDMLNSTHHCLVNILMDTTYSGMAVHNLNAVNDVEACDGVMDLIRHFDSHFMGEHHYYPFRLTHWSDSDKLKMSSFFVSLCDESRYQAAD